MIQMGILESCLSANSYTDHCNCSGVAVAAACCCYRHRCCCGWYSHMQMISLFRALLMMLIISLVFVFSWWDLHFTGISETVSITIDDASHLGLPELLCCFSSFFHRCPIDVVHVHALITIDDAGHTEVPKLLCWCSSSVHLCPFAVVQACSLIPVLLMFPVYFHLCCMLFSPQSGYNCDRCEVEWIFKWCIVLPEIIQITRNASRGFISWTIYALCLHVT